MTTTKQVYDKLEKDAKKVTFSDWVGEVLFWVLRMNLDFTCVFDAAKWFPVGSGKTSNALITAFILDPELDLDRDLVVKDSLREFRENVYSNRPYKVVLVDEAIYFFFKQYWQLQHVKSMTPEFMSNRKEGRFWLLCLPGVWWMIEFMRDARLQWRLKSEKPGTASLFRWNGYSVKKRDEWGRYVTTFENIPKPEPWLWDWYNKRVKSHRCSDEGFIEKGVPACVSKMRK